MLIVTKTEGCRHSYKAEDKRDGGHKEEWLCTERLLAVLLKSHSTDSSTSPVNHHQTSKTANVSPAASGLPACWEQKVRTIVLISRVINTAPEGAPLPVGPNRIRLGANTDQNCYIILHSQFFLEVTSKLVVLHISCEDP